VIGQQQPQLVGDAGGDRGDPGFCGLAGPRLPGKQVMEGLPAVREIPQPPRSVAKRRASAERRERPQRLESHRENQHDGERRQVDHGQDVAPEGQAEQQACGKDQERRERPGALARRATHAARQRERDGRHREPRERSKRTVERR